ncbi:PstS family phosphate ABC transporter substrate-binding protein [Alkalihalobacterium alkalinitrilicum]|uniref:PstS family phosphate ABC transporter substrate-binding protein n=1 Tax=Alkalihalobacterium alkalinitrilicum TaxID=427920 RepID=UPI0009955782|nr:PstS family phosphate ABC transporter substrate-binding protein [Alkalihalobacterium alkalinitrilicum]
MRFFKRSALTLGMASMMMIATACGAGGNETSGSGSTTDNSSSEPAQEEQQDQDDATLSGEIAIDGSSTVFPILEAVSEEYTQVQPGVRAPVGVSGTGGGFKRFVVGETDMSNASRHIKEEEAELAKENSIEYIELELAYDGLSVVVSQENDFVDYLTVEELSKMWTDGTEVETWADVREGWPEEKIEFYSPGTDSGTFDYWKEVILGKDADLRRDATLSEDDNVLVNGTVASPYAIAYFGYAYYEENQDKLNIVPIDNGDGAIIPTIETINDGTYAPLSRPIFTYVNVESVKRTEVYDYLKFLNEHVGDLALEVGYINLPQERYDANLEKIEAAAKN